MDHTQRRRPTIAKEWQLAVLKKLHSESSNPTERQRSAAAAETGLDEKWVKNWFTRQRSKVSARNRRGQSATAEQRQPHVHSATVSTFKLQLSYPPAVPNGPQGLPSRRPVSTSFDPGLTTSTCREPSPTSVESGTASAQAIPHSGYRSISVPTYLNNPPQSPMAVPHTTTPFAYSRDPLCNRYPDFSQFFRPQVHKRFCSSEFSAFVINNHHHHVQLPASPNMESHVAMHFQGLFNLLGPPHLSLPVHQSTSPYLRSCPIAFSMKLVDLLGRP